MGFMSSLKNMIGTLCKPKCIGNASSCCGGGDIHVKTNEDTIEAMQKIAEMIHSSSTYSEYSS